MKILFIVKTYHDGDKFFENKEDLFREKNFEEISEIFSKFYCIWLSEFYLLLKSHIDCQIIFVNNLNLIKDIGCEKTKKKYFDHLNFIFNDYNPDILISNTDDKNFLIKIKQYKSLRVLWKSSEPNKYNNIFDGELFDFIISDNINILQLADLNKIKNSFLLASVPERCLNKKNFLSRKDKLFFSGSLSYQHSDRREIVKSLIKKKIDLEVRSRDIKDYNIFFEKINQIVPFKRYDKNSISNFTKKPIFGIELLNYMSNFKFILNNHSKFDKDYAINYRVFESLASGCLLFTDQNKKLDNYFIDEKHLITYKNKNDLVEKINFYKNNENLGEELSGNGYDIIKQNHTSNIRLQEFKKILQI
tara:strand:+ start:8080 stop:9162 length:1083 start_codon:yes stop_codon:yes gene_type:complete